MSWWCSAQGVPWDWTWRAYPGVWVFVSLLIGGYGAAIRSWPGDPVVSAESGIRARRISAFAAGTLILWLAADWPIGALGAGYLISVHTVQYLLFTLVAPPLLISGMPRSVLRGLLQPRWAWATARVLHRPLPAFLVFNVVMLGTHLPAVVDGLGRTQLGSFAMDMAWLISGIVFWWPVLGPLPELRPLSYPARILYLILNVFIPTVPASFLTFADYPLYAIYELAPSVHGIAAARDQQLAGLLMKVVGGMIIFGTATVLFFRWHQREGDASPGPLAIPRSGGR